MRFRRPRAHPLWCPAAACLVWLAGCAGSQLPAEGPQAYYRTGFPQRDTSRELERILRSVKRIQVTGEYETFRFSADARVTRAELAAAEAYERAEARYRFSRTKTGTAAVIARTDGGMRLVTAAHVTRWPDTVVAYHGGDGGAGALRVRHVESVAILRRQTQAVLGVPGASEFRVVARDTVRDIGLIHAPVRSTTPDAEVPVLHIRAGDPARLVWGAFTYVLGFPRGYPMVSRAIVSDPRRDSDNGFLLDGLFNPGISGGLVLAVRGDTGALEWVGIATAAAGQTELVLVPDARVVEADGILVPYRGNLFAEQVTRIDHGITFSVPMTAVARFLRASGHRLPGAN